MVEPDTDVTHQPALIIGPFLAFKHVVMDVGDHGVSIYNAAVDVGHGYVGIHCKLGLRVSGQRKPYRGY